MARVVRGAAVVRIGVGAASSSCPTCTTNQIFLHLISSNRPQNVRIFLDLLIVVDCCTDTHAIRAIWLFEFEFTGAQILINRTASIPAVELPEVRVRDFGVCAWDGSETDSDVIAVHIAQVIKIRTSSARQSQFYKCCRGLACNSLTFDPKIIQGSPTVSCLTHKLVINPLAACPRPKPNSNSIRIHIQSCLRIGFHFPASPSKQRHSKAPDPQFLRTLVFENKVSCWLVLDFFCFLILQGMRPPTN